ncbi:MAG: hypothetical protein IMZ66_04730, partial [Planctomycetes bacterium]|nr:hypothetical protein [Planctomycetota bacterium]
ITLRDAPPGQVPTEIVFQSDAAKAKPGLAGNLIVNVYGTRTQPPPGAAGAPAAKAPTPAEKAPPAGKPPTPPGNPPAASDEMQEHPEEMQSPAAKAPAAEKTAPAAEKAAPPAPKAPAAPRRFLIGTLPAIPFEVVAP